MKVSLANKSERFESCPVQSFQIFNLMVIELPALVLHSKCPDQCHEPFLFCWSEAVFWVFGECLKSPGHLIVHCKKCLRALLEFVPGFGFYRHLHLGTAKSIASRRRFSPLALGSRAERAL